MASGSTWWVTTCNGEAPRPNAFLIEGGTLSGQSGSDDDGWQRHHRQHHSADQRGGAR